MEEMKLIAEQERNERLAERQRRIEAGESVEDEDDAAEKGLLINMNTFFCCVYLSHGLFRNGTSYT